MQTEKKHYEKTQKSNCKIQGIVKAKHGNHETANFGFSRTPPRMSYPLEINSDLDRQNTKIQTEKKIMKKHRNPIAKFKVQSIQNMVLILILSTEE